MKPTSCTTKVKNPCKICLANVTHKTGLQCMGACKKWAHYKCLHYTPGKIADIKAGIIKVTCPCPNCDTSTPKEYLTNPPYTCSNNQCPANKLPVCTSRDCPVAMSQNISASSQCPPTCPVAENPVAPRSPCPPTPPPPKPSPPPSKTCPPPCLEPTSSLPSPQRWSPPRPKPRQLPYRPPPSCPSGACNLPTSRKPAGNRQYSSQQPRVVSPRPPSCPPECVYPRVQREYSAYNISSPSRSPSCSFRSSDTGDSARYVQCQVSSSDSQMMRNKYDPMMVTLEDMCNTMTKLTVQMKDLMARLVATV